MVSDAPGAPTDLEWGDGWVRRGDRSSGFTAPKNQAMFRVLVEARGNVVHYDTLQKRLWSDGCAPRQVRNCLQAYASHLRRTLAPLGVEVVSVRDRGYRLVDLEHRSNGSGPSETTEPLVMVDHKGRKCRMELIGNDWLYRARPIEEAEIEHRVAATVDVLEDLVAVGRLRVTREAECIGGDAYYIPGDS